MIIVTTDSVAGKRITETLGLVRGNTVRARHIGWDIIAVLKGIVGGEVHEYTKLLAESREQALDQMSIQAEVLGANAIIRTNLVTSYISNNMAEMLAYGTAVILEDD